MREELVVESTDQMRALAHPLRLQILDLLANEPRTNKQVATALGEPPSRVHFHVRELLAAGLIDLVDQRPKGGVLEKYYRAAARQIRFSPALGRPSSPAAGLLGATLTAAGRELARATTYFGQTPPGTTIAHEHARLSAAALARVREHLHAIDEEVRKAKAAPDGSSATQPVVLTYLLHPAPPEDAEH